MRILKLTRRKLVWLILGLLVLAGLFDALALEPYFIETTYHRVQLPVKTRLVVAHLSDLHIRSFGYRETKMIEILNQANPDVVVITGDATGDGGSFTTTREVLKHLQPRLGVWLVRGNWECWLPVSHEKAFYDSFGAHYLINEAKPLREDVWLVGLDDAFAAIRR